MSTTMMVPMQVSAQFYGNVQPSVNPNTCVITQEEFCHDICELEYWGLDVDADSFYSGMPVLINWGRPADRRYFYGYVNHADRHSNALSTTSSLTDRNSTRVVAVGPTWPLKTSGSLGFFNQTSSQIVQTVAQYFSLASYVMPTTTVWGSRLMCGRTFWQFLVERAKEVGYTLISDGIQLDFIPRNTNPSHLLRPIVTFDYAQKLYDFPIFDVTVGATAPVADFANRFAATVNPYTNNPIWAVQNGSPFPYAMGSTPENALFSREEHFTAHSMLELQTQVSGKSAENQLYMGAKASLAGNPYIFPGTVINILNANGSQNGIWYVMKAVHRFSPTNYTLDVWLGRDSRGETQQATQVLSSSSPPTATLVNGVWRAV